MESAPGTSRRSSSNSNITNKQGLDNLGFTGDNHQVMPLNGVGETPPHYEKPPTLVMDILDKTNGDLPHQHKQEEAQDYSLITLIPILQRGKIWLKNTIPVREDEWPRVRKTALSAILAAGYIAYFVAVLVVKTMLEDGDYWCDGDGMLIILTYIAVVGISYFQVIKPLFGKSLNRIIVKPITNMIEKAFSHMWVAILFPVVVFGALVAFIIYDAWDEKIRLQSFSGIVALVGLGFLFSAAPAKVRWRHIVWGLALQYMMGLIVLKWSVGEAIFKCLAGKVATFLAFTDAGSTFVFGILVSEYEIFAFKVLSVTLFFSFCIQILYYFGVMQWIVVKMGWFLQVTIGTTACESVNAAANIFLGQTEAPLLIKPYLPKMTKSEIHAVMTGGFATIAGSVLAAYISFGVDAVSLLSASVMNAPAALAFSKLFYPEVEESKTTTKDINIDKGDEANWLHAAMVGVTNAIPMVANIAANLICFYAFIALLSHVLNWFCMLAGADDGVCYIENLFGWIFMPLAWVLGVKWEESHKVGELIGLKTIVNEFVAYDALAKMINAGELSKRAELIATYALCGFSNISAIGIMLGGLGTMAPERKRDMATIVVRAMIAGSCASFLTSCVAGTLMSASDI